MDQRHVGGRTYLRQPLSFCLGQAVLLGLLGCVNPATRSQKADEPEPVPEYEVQTVGDMTSGFANAEPVPVSGVGLVTNLQGTGGDAPPSSFRKYLEADLRKRGFEHVDQLLKSPDTAMVFVSAMIPPGSHKGDMMDVDISLPPNSRVTSLRGGRLLKCGLFNYENLRDIAPRFNSDQLIKGHTLAWAQGTVLVGFGDDREDTKLRHGRIWSGAQCVTDRPLALILEPTKHRSWPVAKQITERINETYHVAPDGMENPVAYARPNGRLDNPVLFVRVPPQYKNNVAHFLRVVRLIPVMHDPAKDGTYRSRLRKELLEPDHTITAALRLEALGSDAVPALKAGLDSDHPLVRFAAAEALAYLDCSAAGEVLGELAEDQPELRGYCLAALASLNESVSHVQLEKLLGSKSSEARYGAFRGLLTLDERDPSVRGEFLNDAVWLHRVAPHTAPLVHLSTNRRPEIVEFGEDIRLVPPFAIAAGDFTIVAGKADTGCMVSHFSLNHPTERQQCGLDLDQVLRTMTSLGGQYPDAYEVVRQADLSKVLTCPVVINALPEAMDVDALARQGKALKDVPEEIRNARTELGGTPTLFDSGTQRTAAQ